MPNSTLSVKNMDTPLISVLPSRVQSIENFDTMTISVFQRVHISIYPLSRFYVMLQLTPNAT